MIATVKVLGLKAGDFSTLAAAAWRIVEYVQGGPGSQQPLRTGAARYYAGASKSTSKTSATAAPGVGGDLQVRVAHGTARGSAAVLMGLDGSVAGEELHRLLMGQHAGTGRWLVPGRGSPGRALAAARAVPAAAIPPQPEMMTLPQAAQVAGVTASYLRRLAENYELDHAAPATSSATATVTSGALAGPDRATEGRAGPGTLPGEGPASFEPSGEYLAATRDPSGRRWLVTRQELGRFMRERQPPTVVIGYDLVCSAPKSVSLLWAFGDQQLRADISAALNAGVDATLAYLEEYGVVGTVQGRNRPGLGLAAASYQHEISRSEEAHLHLHNVVANAVPVPLVDENGHPVLDEQGVARVEWRTLDSEVFLRHVRTAGFVGAAALRHELAARRGLDWGPVRNGVAELAGFPRGLLEAFSTRHGEVSEEFAQLVEAGFSADATTKAAAQAGSRAAKRVLSDPQVEAIQRRKLTEAGWSVPRMQALAAPRARQVEPPTSRQIEAFLERLTGPVGLTHQQSTFTQREVHQQVAAWAGDRLDAPGVRALTQRVLADPRLVRMRVAAKRRRNQDEDTYTTAELLEIEDALMALHRQGRTDHGAPPHAPVAPGLGEDAITAISDRIAAQTGDPAARLSDEQGTLVRQLLAAGDLIRPVMGPAGTGKTDAMRALVHAYTAAGYTVLGSANGGRQAEELHERLEIRSEVIAAWLTRLNGTDQPEQVWPAGTVLIVDEATQVSTRDAERLLRYATRTATVVILVGDPAQLGSVGAGGWFRHLIDTSRAGGAPVPGLTVNQRQTGETMRHVRHALAALRPELPAADRQALSILARDGRVVVVVSREQMLEAIVEDWHTERRLSEHPRAAATTHGLTASRLAGRSRMMAEHHRDTDLLNQAARARLSADGTLTGPALRVAGRQFQAGDEVITLTQAGHTLIPAGRPRSAYIRTGTVGIITAVHLDPGAPERQNLTVLFPDRGQVTVGWDYLTHEFPDGRDGGLAHAYALTAHKAEGTTMPTARALLHEQTSRAGLYVMLSRAKSDLRAYLIRARDLSADLDGEDWLPVIPDTDGPMRALLDHIAQSREERLASDYDPIARAAQQLATGHTPAELTELRRRALHDITHDITAPSQRLDQTPGPGRGRPDRLQAYERALVLYRAELAAAARIGREAVADPDPQLLAMIGPRPANGPHLALWDQTVTALAIHAARPRPHPPHRPAQRAPLAGAEAGDDGERLWAEHRHQAEQLAHRWAEQLPPARRRRFHTSREQVPRQRAVAGLHALIALGRAPEQLHAALTGEPVTDVRAGAPVLEHRVQDLLLAAGQPAAAELYQLPAPDTDQVSRRRVEDLFGAARIHHLAGQPTGHLVGELDHLTRVLTIVSPEGETPETPQTPGTLGSREDVDHHDERRRELVRDLTKRHADAEHEEETAAQDRRNTHDALIRLELQRRSTTAAIQAARTAEIEAETHLARARQARRLTHAALLIVAGPTPPQPSRVVTGTGDGPGDIGVTATGSAESEATTAEAIEGALSAIHERRHLLDEALSQQIDRAAMQLAQEPAAYLTALLGERPQHPAAAGQWQRHAIAVEHYRHHHLGLPYGEPAAPAGEPASIVALGHRPADPEPQALYDRLLHAQRTFDIAASL